MTKKEFLLFNLLVKNKWSVDIEAIILGVWGERCRGVTPQNIAQLTYLIRKKINYLAIPVTIIHSKKEGISTISNKRVFFINCNENLVKFIMILIKKTVMKKTT